MFLTVCYNLLEMSGGKLIRNVSKMLNLEHRKERCENGESRTDNEQKRKKSTENNIRA